MRSAREIAKGPAPATETSDGAARTATRLTAFILASLIAVHLVFLFEMGGESPVWSSAMLDLQERLEAPIAVSHEPLGLAFAVLGTLLAIAIWRWASRLAALIFAAAAGWEAFLNGQTLLPSVLVGESIPQMTLLSSGLVLLGLLASLVALFAAIAHHVGRRRDAGSSSQRAEAMALRLRARR